MGHKIYTGASVLAGLGSTFIYIILTIVTRIASWTLYQGKKKMHSAPRDTDMPGHTCEHTESHHKRTHTDIQHTGSIGGQTYPEQGNTLCLLFLCV